ncbi:UNKNOWN [Stylonychia lemnae]|uniref:Uncharacterized protein n=1 Tax=Stylonychia lemnae TaxID=5949 RepID=A0A078A5K5_STYLE|nr:UNKNOWN [Stylonychia lemnae]|eukprot:CDW76039.1 UNKNOWN [Stylonychia lemnae]
MVLNKAKEKPSVSKKQVINSARSPQQEIRSLPTSTISGPGMTMRSKISNNSSNTQIQRDRLNFTHDMTKNIDTRQSVAVLSNFTPFKFKQSDISNASTQAQSVNNRFEKQIGISTAATPAMHSSLKKMQFIFCSGNDIANQENRQTLKSVRDKNESSFSRQGFTVEAAKHIPNKKMFENKNLANTSLGFHSNILGNSQQQNLDSSMNFHPRSRPATPSRDPILQGDIQLITSGKKKVKDEHSQSSKHNSRYTPQLHFYQANQDITQQREEFLQKKFQSNVLSRQTPVSNVIDNILNDIQPWKNDSKNIFSNVKRKSDASWTKPQIQGIIREVDSRGRNTSSKEAEFTFKITNPTLQNDYKKRSCSKSIEESQSNYRRIKDQHRTSNVFNLA